MTTKTVYQIDTAGRYVGITRADESPKEPGVWLMPAGTVEAAPPEEWPEGKMPRWNGTAWGWVSVREPQPAPAVDPVAKLQAFLQANPDVTALLASKQGGV
jgi:hypothetical protein